MVQEGQLQVTIIASKEKFPFKMFTTFSISLGFNLSETSLRIFHQDCNPIVTKGEIE